jgi:hypothetical protein
MAHMRPHARPAPARDPREGRCLVNRILFLAYCLGIGFAILGAFLGGDLWVIGLAVAVYALTHLLLRHIDQKETSE